ncbi:MAG: nicotinate (nicotinamide) nucleotide adenylyltransferase [Verrucomicrobiota bacterium]
MNDIAKKKRICLYGGTFDPIHMGHLLIAEDALLHADLDEVIFLPAYSAPLRSEEPSTPASERLAMVRLAVEGFEKFTVDDYEVRQGKRMFTIDTVAHFAKRLPDAKLFFLIGFDQLKQLDDWRGVEELKKTVTFLCAQRGDETPVSYDHSAVSLLPPRRIDISATEIRDRVAKRESVRSLLPQAVADYLEKKRLYRRG